MFFNKKIKVLLICGISGSGKTFIESNLIKNSNDKISFNKLRQVTTRKPRSQEEIDLKIYDFITEEEYDEIKDSLIACSELNGFRYGTYSNFKKSTRSKTVINTIVVNKKGYDHIINVLKNNKNIDILTIEITADEDEIKDRQDRNLIKEKEELEGIADIKIDNSFNNRTNAYEVIKKLKEIKFI